MKVKSLSLSVFLVSSFLTGCLQSEAECSKQLKVELDQMMALADEKIAKPDPDAVLTKKDWLKVKLLAAQTAMRVTTIDINENMNTCDYFLDGTELRRK